MPPAPALLWPFPALAYRVLLCVGRASEFMFTREPVPYSDDVAPRDAELAGRVSEHALVTWSLQYLPMNGYAGGEDADVNFRWGAGLSWICSTGVPWFLAGELCGAGLAGDPYAGPSNLAGESNAWYLTGDENVPPLWNLAGDEEEGAGNAADDADDDSKLAREGDEAEEAALLALLCDNDDDDVGMYADDEDEDVPILMLLPTPFTGKCCLSCPFASEPDNCRGGSDAGL
jgi:hypothetical protein